VGNTQGKYQWKKKYLISGRLLELERGKYMNNPQGKYQWKRNINFISLLRF